MVGYVAYSIMICFAAVCTLFDKFISTLRERVRTNKVFTKDQHFYLNYFIRYKVVKYRKILLIYNVYFIFSLVKM